MSTFIVNPYLFFQGDAKEAMEFYKSIFGGELSLQTYGDVNATSEATPAEYLMHASLTGGDVALMASDTAQASDKAAKVTISINGEADDEQKLTTIFNRLSEGVTVEYPLKKEFWGDIFGSVTDKYGIDWMINIATKKD